MSMCKSWERDLEMFQIIFPGLQILTHNYINLNRICNGVAYTEHIDVH